MTSASEEKWRTFKFFFLLHGTGGSPTRPDPENRVGDHDIGSPGRPISSWLQVPGEPGHKGISIAIVRLRHKKL
jgi:hypothetical protein